MGSLARHMQKNYQNTILQEHKQNHSTTAVEANTGFKHVRNVTFLTLFLYWQVYNAQKAVAAPDDVLEGS